MPVDPNADVEITAFDWVPDFAKGQVRDLRVRWALEEVGVPYRVRLLPQGDQKQAEHRARNPFGQVPTYQQGDLTLFESGAIVLHIADRHPGLVPEDAGGRARAIGWVFAALNTVEPPIGDYVMASLFEASQPSSKARLPAIEQRIHDRLKDASQRLGEQAWFDGDRFTAGDLMMAATLGMIADKGFLGRYSNLTSFVERATARPAFQQALADQLAGFTGSPPPGFDRWLKDMAAARQGEMA